MRTHIKVLSILHILYGLSLLSINFLVSIAASLAASYPGQVIMGHSKAYIFGPDFVMRSLPIWLFSILAVFVGVPQIVGAIGLLLRKHWARVLIAIIGVLCLVDFPFGTGLGVYTFWVLLRMDPEQAPASQSSG
ncbi:MAG: hypothetical protein JSV52_14410 [Candidatus Zixiibacteriota bacterium]|nr:MAG: hypothetical protein JSV52_14410 [candidate division Zixibacteria bacterium]